MESLADLAREVHEFEMYENNWPPDWSADEVDDRIDQHHSVLEAAEQAGLHKLGAGGFRVVFEIQPRNAFGLPANHVLKVSKYQGTKQNAEAVHAFQNLPSEMHEHVASIVDWHSTHEWIVQEKASSAKPGDAQTVHEALQDHGYGCSDLRAENCGRVDGQPVLTDLGLLR